MRVEAADGTEYYSQGTGFLVKSNVVVSCAHTIVYTGTDRVVEMKVYYGVHQDSIDNSNFIRPQRWTYSNAYVENPNDRQNDWVVIELQESFVYPYCFTCTPNSIGIGSKVYISGYPADHNYYQYTSAGTVLLTMNNKVEYTNDTIGGMSGAPVYTENGYLCYAIHTNGGSITNSGCKITTGIFNTICYVMNNS